MHQVSNLDVIGMVRKLIYLANIDNHTSNVTDRLLGLKHGEQVATLTRPLQRFMSEFLARLIVLLTITRALAKISLGIDQLYLEPFVPIPQHSDHD